MTEWRQLEATFNSLATHITLYLTESMWYNMLQQLLTKYLWSASGFFLIAMIMFSDEYTMKEVSRAGTDGAEGAALGQGQGMGVKIRGRQQLRMGSPLQISCSPQPLCPGWITPPPLPLPGANRSGLQSQALCYGGWEHISQAGPSPFPVTTGVQTFLRVILSTKGGCET